MLVVKVSVGIADVRLRRVLLVMRASVDYPLPGRLQQTYMVLLFVSIFSFWKIDPFHCIVNLFPSSCQQPVL